MPLEDPGSRTGAEDNSKRQPRTTRGGFNLLLFSTASEEFWHLIFWTTSQFESPVLSGYGRYDIRDERHRLESNKKVKESPVLAEGTLRLSLWSSKALPRLATGLLSTHLAFWPILAPRLTP